MSEPRKVSAAELKRHKKKGKVRRKMGAQPVKEKPVSVAPVDMGMSGSVSPEPPAPAPEPAPAPVPEPVATMSASNIMRDTLLETLIENNTQAIQDFRLALAEQKPRRGVAYRHKVVRDSKSSLINEVISTPMEQ